MKQDLVVETQTPQKQVKRADRPRYDVPIMIEITQSDFDNASQFASCDHCLIATALKRLRHKVLGVGSPSVVFLDENRVQRWFTSDDILHHELCNGCNYKPEVVGKQIILYPSI